MMAVCAVAVFNVVVVASAERAGAALLTVLFHHLPSSSTNKRSASALKKPLLRSFQDLVGHFAHGFALFSRFDLNNFVRFLGNSNDFRHYNTTFITYCICYNFITSFICCQALFQTFLK